MFRRKKKNCAAVKKKKPKDRKGKPRPQKFDMAHKGGTPGRFEKKNKALPWASKKKKAALQEKKRVFRVRHGRKTRKGVRRLLETEKKKVVFKI